MMSGINKQGRDHALRLQIKVRTAFENAGVIAAERLRISLIEHLVAKEDSFAGTDIIEKVVTLGPESILISLNDHFLVPRFGEDLTDTRILEHNLRLEFGNREALRILSSKTDPQEVVDAFCRKYDSALVSLYRSLPDDIRANNGDPLGEPIIPDNFYTLPLEKQAMYVRIWLEAKNGMGEGALRTVTRVGFHHRVSVLPYELRCLRGLRDLYLENTRSTTVPRIFSELIGLELKTYSPFLMEDVPLDIEELFGGHMIIPFQLLIGTTKITSQIVAAFPKYLKDEIYQEVAEMSEIPVFTDPVWGELHAGDDLHLLRQCTLEKIFYTLRLQFGLHPKERVSEEDFGRICFHVWDLAGKPEDRIGDWGERYLLTDFQRFKEALARVLFEKLSPRDRDLFDFLSWLHSGPLEGDLLYGQHHRYDDLNDPYQTFYVQAEGTGRFHTIKKYRSIKEQYDRLDVVWQEKIYTKISNRCADIRINADEDRLFLRYNGMFLDCVGELSHLEICYKVMTDYYLQMQSRLPEAVNAIYTTYFGEEALTRTRFYERRTDLEGNMEFFSVICSYFIFYKLEELGHHLTREEAEVLESDVVPYLSILGSDGVPKILARFLTKEARERLLGEIDKETLYFVIRVFRASFAPIPIFV
ncbi:MAG: hypothetical protein KBC64_02265 [Simkaniaceae bacterium]|nr:hypothetical protein [Simkaniaceae bacterium]